MSFKTSEPLSFLDQVMEICDRILNQQPMTEGRVHHDREDSPSTPVDQAAE
jgi:hypothetical protein